MHQDFLITDVWLET